MQPVIVVWQENGDWRWRLIIEERMYSGGGYAEAHTAYAAAERLLASLEK